MFFLIFWVLLIIVSVLISVWMYNLGMYIFIDYEISVIECNFVLVVGDM